MDILKTEIGDVLLLRPSVHADSRGHFFESYNKMLLSIEPYYKWKNISTGLTKYKNQKYTYIANNLDNLIDCPIAIGNQDIYPFLISGVKHEYAIIGIGNYDIKQIIKDTKKIISSTIDIFDDIPYEHYTFLLYNQDNGYGGLEHSNSCSMIRSRWKYKNSSQVLGKYLF